MDIPKFFGPKKLEKLTTMEHNIMGDMVRPRRTSGWATYNRQKFNIRGTVDSPHYKSGRKVIPEKQHESVKQIYSTGIKQKENIIGRNTDSLTKTFTEYCDKCSLHGLKYVGDLQLHPLERMFWAISFILAVATAAYFITLLYHKWEENPVIISVGATSTQLTSIPFPALTICNMNRARKSVAKKIADPKSPDHVLNMILLKDLCNDSYEIYDNNNIISKDMQKRIGKWDTIQTFMSNVSQSCEQMIKSCSYAGSIEKCQDIFNPSLTDEGICCSFNKVRRDYIFRNPRDLSDLNVTFPKPVTDWTPEAGYPPGYTTETIPWKPRGAGSHLGLTLMLDANLDDYYCSSTASTGFKMRLHNPVETPKIAEFGFLISAGQEYRLAIKPTINNASSSIRRIPPNKRQCVFSNEKYLKYYRTYTQRNCAMECEANYTLAMCKCVPYYMPKDSNTTICAKKDENCIKNARNAIEMRLVDESVNTSNFERDGQDLPPKHCHCLPGCTELRYRATISSGMMFETPSLNTEYDEIRNRTYFRTNMAVVHVFFTESQFMNYYKSELFGLTEFLSNTGGLLGLFLGFSFLSAVEVIYFMSMRLWCSIIQRRQHAANQQASLPLTNSSHVSIITPYPFAQ